MAQKKTFSHRGRVGQHELQQQLQHAVLKNRCGSIVKHKTISNI